MAKTLLELSKGYVKFFVDKLVAYSTHLGEPQKDRETILKKRFVQN